MASRLREWVAPAYLFACLVLGGSGQGIWANMVLQLVGLVLIACAAAVARGNPMTREQRQRFGRVLAALSIVALQLVPLPPRLWSHLGPRSILADGFRILGID